MEGWWWCGGVIVVSMQDDVKRACTRVSKTYTNVELGHRHLEAARALRACVHGLSMRAHSTSNLCAHILKRCIHTLNLCAPPHCSHHSPNRLVLSATHDATLLVRATIGIMCSCCNIAAARSFDEDDAGCVRRLCIVWVTQRGASPRAERGLHWRGAAGPTTSQPW